MDVACPHCELSIALADEQLREEIVCPSCGSSFKAEPGSTSTWSPSEGQRTLGRFELIDHIGMGAFGTVYKARDPELDRLVAIKVPRAAALATKEDLDRFLREARSVAQLRHPGIVPVFEVGKADDLPFLVSEYVDGVTLSDLSTGRRPAYDEAAELIEAVARALEYAHAQGVIHRDVKPANIIVGEDGQPRLMDFGLAKRDMGETTMTVDGQVIGTPAYMSPEQASGQAHHVDGRSDVYSLGVIFYWLLTGKLPFQGNSRMLIFQVQHDEPPPPRKLDKSVPRDLETICLKAMAKDPNQRYFTAHGLAEDLQRYRNGEPIHARRVSPITRLWRWCRRKPAVAGLCVSLMALAVSVCVLAVFMFSLRVTGPLGIFLDEKLPAERRLEALKEVTLNEPAIVLQVLEALERAQDDDFVENGLSILSNEPIAGGWNPEAFKTYTRLVFSPDSTIELIADLSSGAVGEDLLSAMLAYLDRLDLSTLDNHERAGVLRALIVILDDHPNVTVVFHCRAILNSLDTHDLIEWLFKADSGVELEESGELSLVKYAEQASQPRAEEIGEYLQDQIIELAAPDADGFIEVTSRLEYFIGAIGEIQQRSNVGYHKARELLLNMIERRRDFEINEMLGTVVTSYFSLSKDPGPLREVPLDSTASDNSRLRAIEILGEAHDQKAFGPLFELAENTKGERGILNLQEAAIRNIKILANDLWTQGKGTEHLIDPVLKLVNQYADNPLPLSTSSIEAFGEVAGPKESTHLFDFLLDRDRNRSATAAIHGIIVHHPSMADRVVEAYFSWYSVHQQAPAGLPVPLLHVLLEQRFSGLPSSDLLKRMEEARKKMLAAFANGHMNTNAAVRKLAAEMLHSCLLASDAPKLEPEATEQERASQLQDWKTWWTKNRRDFHLREGGVISR